jgi:hypothetical protein
MPALNVSDWISLVSALGTIAAVAVALFLHGSQVRSAEAREKRISALAAFRVASSVFTLLSQIKTVQLKVRTLDTLIIERLDIHREFLELSEYCQAISNPSIEALSIFDHHSAIELAEGLGRIESLANKVKIVQGSDYWRNAIPDHRTQLLIGWDNELTEAFFKVENSTSFRQHLSDNDDEVESKFNVRRGWSASSGRAVGKTPWTIKRWWTKSLKP